MGDRLTAQPVQSDRQGLFSFGLALNGERSCFVNPGMLSAFPFLSLRGASPEALESAASLPDRLESMPWPGTRRLGWSEWQTTTLIQHQEASSPAGAVAPAGNKDEPRKTIPVVLPSRVTLQRESPSPAGGSAAGIQNPGEPMLSWRPLFQPQSISPAAWAVQPQPRANGQLGSPAGLSGRNQNQSVRAVQPTNVGRMAPAKPEPFMPDCVPFSPFLNLLRGRSISTAVTIAAGSVRAEPSPAASPLHPGHEGARTNRSPRVVSGWARPDGDGVRKGKVADQTGPAPEPRALSLPEKPSPLNWRAVPATPGGFRFDEDAAAIAARGPALSMRVLTKVTEVLESLVERQITTIFKRQQQQEREGGRAGRLTLPGPAPELPSFSDTAVRQLLRRIQTLARQERFRSGLPD